MTGPLPKLVELLAYLDESRARLLETAHAMNPTFAQIRPRDEEWSAAENLSHLAAVEKSVLRLIGKAIEESRDGDLGADESAESVLGSLDRFKVASGLPKVISPERIAPDPNAPVADSVAALTATREQLREVLLECGDLNLSAIKRPHPMLRDLNLYQWVLFVAQHEERHRQQIDATLAAVTERAAESAPIV
ncbi:MAG: DinB family protein [Gemmatimonadaceae bacterium]